MKQLFLLTGIEDTGSNGLATWLHSSYTYVSNAHSVSGPFFFANPEQALWLWGTLVVALKLGLRSTV